MLTSLTGTTGRYGPSSLSDHREEVFFIGQNRRKCFVLVVNVVKHFKGIIKVISYDNYMHNM